MYRYSNIFKINLNKLNETQAVQKYVVVRKYLQFVLHPTTYTCVLFSLQATLSAPVCAILLFPVRHNRVLNKEVHNNVTCCTVTFRPHTQVQGVFSSPRHAAPQARGCCRTYYAFIYIKRGVSFLLQFQLLDCFLIQAHRSMAASEFINL